MSNDPELVQALTAQRERVAMLSAPALDRSQSRRDDRMADDYARSRLDEALAALHRDAQVTAECFESVGLDARTVEQQRALERRVEQLQRAVAAGLFDQLDLPPRTVGTELL